MNVATLQQRQHTQESWRHVPMCKAFGQRKQTLYVSFVRNVWSCLPERYVVQRELVLDCMCMRENSLIMLVSESVWALIVDADISFQASISRITTSISASAPPSSPHCCIVGGEKDVPGAPNVSPIATIASGLGRQWSMPSLRAAMPLFFLRALPFFFCFPMLALLLPQDPASTLATCAGTWWC